MPRRPPRSSTSRSRSSRRGCSRRSGATAAAIGLACTAMAGMLVGCGSGPGPRADGRLRVEASFYPLQWIAEQVGGPDVAVSSLTKPGAEPHDLELTPRDVGTIEDADLVVALRGFQPAVDTATDQLDRRHVFDAAASARLDLTSTPIEDGRRVPGSSRRTDPHFWLDPQRLRSVADALAERLAGRDPDRAAGYRARARRLGVVLDELDADLRTGLRSCTARDLVTTHNAFGYLARRYGLRQVAITGLTPEDEPSPRDLARVSDFVARHHVRTIYFETLVGPDIARAVATETGAQTAVLDPIEGINDRSQGRDYLQIMRANLTNLRRGQSCR